MKKLLIIFIALAFAACGEPPSDPTEWVSEFDTVQGCEYSKRKVNHDSWVSPYEYQHEWSCSNKDCPYKELKDLKY